MIDKERLIRELTMITYEVLDIAQLKAGDIFVLGCSTSEIVGGVIGKNSNQEIGEWVVATLLAILSEREIFLAVQGCEHLNRALVVEKSAQERYNLEEVAVVPQLHAGGACSVAAFRYFIEPVEVEHIVAKAGIDLGDTSIGMHIKHVQVPIRPSIRELGGAHVTALYSRPKYIGGSRAKYE